MQLWRQCIPERYSALLTCRASSQHRCQHPQQQLQAWHAVHTKLGMQSYKVQLYWQGVPEQGNVLLTCRASDQHRCQQPQQHQCMISKTAANLACSHTKHSCTDRVYLSKAVSCSLAEQAASTDTKTHNSTNKKTLPAPPPSPSHPSPKKIYKQ